MNRQVATKLNLLGEQLAERGWLTEAQNAYLEAIEADEDWAVPWLNLGLLHKRACDWRKARRYTLQATELEPSNQSAWWNLGIAATALRDWIEARRAWRQCGLEAADGDGPVEIDLGPAPIRLQAHGEDDEVVWCRRTDPARAVVAGVPLPHARRRHGDVLLHDGEPTGHRVLDGKRLPVFDEIELFEASELSTFAVTVLATGVGALAELEERARSMALCAVRWPDTVVPLRAAPGGFALDGLLHAGSQTEGRRVLGVAARSEREVAELLGEWEQHNQGCRARFQLCLTPAEQ
jgi:tetratricopeptide (TPR) repeat protein